MQYAPIFATLPGSTSPHAIVSFFAGGSIATWCNGRWPSSTPDVQVHTGRPDDACPACLMAVSLAELVEVTR